jgi:hypothetical protein
MVGSFYFPHVGERDHKMIIVLKPEADGAVAKEILEQIERLGCRPLHMPGTERVVLGALGDERVLGTLHLENHPAARCSPTTPWSRSAECRSGAVGSR